MKFQPIILAACATFGIVFTEIVSQSFRDFYPAKVIAASNRVTNGQIIGVQGNAEIKRQNGWVFLPQLGTRLYPGDQLKTAADSQLVILCTDFSVQIINGNKTNFNQCLIANDTPKSDCYPHTDCPHRGDDITRWNSTERPYIISPQKTKLLNPQPMLQWQGVPGVTSYTVSLQENGQEIWQHKDVAETQLQYTGELPLKPGSFYQLVVKTNTGISSQDVITPGGVEFSLLEEEKATEVRQEVEKIKQKQLNPVSEKLAIATLYQQYKLISESIELLDLVRKAAENTAPIDAQLGDLYWQKWQLAPLAKIYYTKAVQAANPQDLETLILAKNGLGEVEISLGNKPAALQIFRELKAAYEKLGESEAIQEVEKQINDLEKP